MKLSTRSSTMVWYSITENAIHGAKKSIVDTREIKILVITSSFRLERSTYLGWLSIGFYLENSAIS